MQILGNIAEHGHVCGPLLAVSHRVFRAGDVLVKSSGSAPGASGNVSQMGPHVVELLCDLAPLCLGFLTML